VVLLAGVGVAIGVLLLLPVAVDRGLAQPIPFSHRIHVKTKRVNCFFCHPSAMRSANAGMPALEKCLLCHRVIASNFEPIARIRSYYARNQSPRWNRVLRLPDFVRFSHQPHLAVGHDCGECHGNVAEMDRVKPAYKIDMNFCITCHRRNKATTDCFACHY